MKQLKVTAILALVFSSFVFASQVRAGLSGDPAIDLGISVGYTIRAGGSGPGVDRNGNVWKCGTSGSHPLENKCPNSASFTPAEATGGKQSWGVGVQPIFLEEEEFVCGIEFEPVFVPFFPFIIFEPEVVCDLVPTYEAHGTWGEAMVILEWGSENGLTQSFSNQPTSLMAYQESLLDECNPNLLAAQAGFDTPCLDQSNSSHVTDNGYESDIRISDSACNPSLLSLGKRVHGPTDYDANCFTHFQFQQLSNLPGDYQDTTFADDANEFNIGFGSSEAFALQPGTTYVANQLFASKAQPNMNGTLAVHEGAITTNVNTALTLFGVCSSTTLGGCYFTVKDAPVGGPGDTFTQIIPPSP